MILLIYQFDESKIHRIFYFMIHRLIIGVGFNFFNLLYLSLYYILTFNYYLYINY